MWRGSPLHPLLWGVEWRRGETSPGVGMSGGGGAGQGEKLGGGVRTRRDVGVPWEEKSGVQLGEI